MAVHQLVRGLTRHYPLLSGCFVANSPVFNRIVPGPDPAEGAVTVSVRDGVRIRVDPHDFVGRAVYFFGDIDPKISRICRRLLRPGDTFLDVGANCGLLSLVAARAVGPGGSVLAFEPQPGLAESIRLSCELNGFRQVAVHNVALSDHAGVMDLYLDPVNSGRATVAAGGVGFGYDGSSVRVEVRPTAEFLTAGRRPRLMKVDVEGHEAEVIRGIGDLKGDTAPSAIVFEACDRKEPFWERATVKALSEGGYALYHVRKSYVRLRLAKALPGADQPGDSWDVLAVREAELPEVAGRLGL
jgi:FkbM family methyltransferase